MLPTACRVLALVPGAAGEPSEAAGSIAVARAEGEAVRVTTARPDLEVTAVLSRDEALAVLLAAADALGMVLLDPRDAAKRTAAAMRRRR